MRTPAGQVHLGAHLPWMLGLLLAPLLRGSVSPELLAVVSALFSLSLLGLAFRLGEGHRPVVPGWLILLAGLLLVLPLVPLPAALVRWLSPSRWALEVAFPINIPRPWLSLALSPADTVQRLWEIGLLLAVFALARHAGHERVTAQGLAFTVMAAVLLLAGSEVLYRATGQQKLLGLWETTWGKGAGTFDNRNHFANWLVVGCLFLFGWWLRSVHPLHAARPNGRSGVRRHRALSWLIALTALFALTMAVLSGSRGGAIALLAGSVAWGAMIMRRSRSRQRQLILVLSALGGLALLIASGDFLFDRLAQARQDMVERYPKAEIWRQAWLLFLRFPWLGVGPGGFTKAFNHFKTSGGDTTAWHAENDWIQSLVESGLLGALTLMALLLPAAAAVVRQVWIETSDEPELLFGAAAGLIAFAVHASIEFVFQMPATALLAAALLGFTIGVRDVCPKPVVPLPPRRRRVVLNLAAGVLLAVAAAAQGLSTHHWRAATARDVVKAPSSRAALVEESLAWWPWAAKRQLGLTRLQVAAISNEPKDVRIPMAEAIRRRLNDSIALDPLNWELRLERAWLDLAFFRTTPRPRITVAEAVRINPLQAQTPIAFASALVSRDPDWARELLFLVDRSSLANLRRVLPVAVRLPSPDALCLELTPDTTPALRTLAAFALERNLQAIAVLAADRMRGRVSAAETAEIYRQAGRADRVPEVSP